jgi:hypothetical protein
VSKTNLLILIPSTYVCTCVRCVCVCVCVCDERGGSMSAAVKVKSLNPFAEGGGSSTNNERPGNHPSSTKIQH